MQRLEKLMSISRSEFEQSWLAFEGTPPPAPGSPVCLAIGSGHVEIAYEPRPAVRLGGLLELPRAAVTFVFHRAEAADCAKIIDRFDRAFQRGGG